MTKAEWDSLADKNATLDALNNRLTEIAEAAQIRMNSQIAKMRIEKVLERWSQMVIIFFGVSIAVLVFLMSRYYNNVVGSTTFIVGDVVSIVIAIIAILISLIVSVRTSFRWAEKIPERLRIIRNHNQLKSLSRTMWSCYVDPSGVDFKAYQNALKILTTFENEHHDIMASVSKLEGQELVSPSATSPSANTV